MSKVKIRNKSIIDTWTQSLKYLVDCQNVVPTERNLDTYEVTNAILEVEKPLENRDILLAFEKKRSHNYTEKSYVKYWKIVHDKLKKFPKTSVAQIDIITDKLSNSPYNRHGYASIWAPSIDLKTDYPSCIIGIYFMIRDEKLNMTAMLRSNDAWGQALNDMYELVKIQEEIAMKLQLEVGIYTHFAASYHLYTKDRMDAQLFLKEKENKNEK